jgi:hypothetical protein
MATRELVPLRLVNPPAVPRDEQRAVTHIYRPSFISGILSVLTAGCLLGAIALLGIALNSSYTASAWTPYVLAHANSQLYGWVGFFVIGFALQQHAPRMGRLHLFYGLAKWSLGLMAAGIALRFVSEPMVRVDSSVWLPIGVLSCVLQLIAVGLFMANVALTRYRTGEGLAWQTAFVFTSLFWWLLVAAAEPFFFALAHGANGVAFTAEWFSPYREAQFLGFVGMMIFGVALVKMHSCFGAAEACPKLGLAGFAFWNLGLLARMFGWVLNYRSDMAQPWIWHMGGGLLAVGAILLVLSTRMFMPLRNSIRAHKFIRAAFGWLVVSGVLLALEPLHLALTGQVFSHAYTGAIRHAVTVGFISQMIIGVSVQVIANMNDLPAAALRPLWSVFWLLNVGNALRVALEIGTDYSAAAFLPMGVTGFVELTALLVWAADVLVPMMRSRRLAHG